MMLTSIFKKVNNRFIGEGNEPRRDQNNNVLKFNREYRFQKQRLRSLENYRDKNYAQTEATKFNKIEDEKICRICRLSGSKTKETLISPCGCKGTSAHIHRTCLEKWLRRSGSTCCELCRFNYKIKIIDRYSKIDSIKKWFTDDDNFDESQDLIVDFTLAAACLPIVFICCYAFSTLCSEASRINVPTFSRNAHEIKQKLWLIFMLGCATIILTAGYSCWILLRSIHHHKKWSNWVRRHGKLIILDNKKNL